MTKRIKLSYKVYYNYISVSSVLSLLGYTIVIFADNVAADDRGGV